MVEGMYQITWGRFTLWCSMVSSSTPRSIVVHELADGDKHPLQDRGRGTRRTRCTLLFDEMKGETTPPIERFRAFKRAAVDVGGTAMFTHPIDGRYVARVADFDYDLDDDGNVSSCVAEFIEDTEFETVSPASAGVVGQTGEGSVAAAAAALDEALAAVDLDTTITADAVALQDSWSSGEDPVASRQIFVDAADISNQIAGLIEGYSLEDDLEYFDSYRAAIMLGEAMRSAALAATSETSSVFRVRLTKPTSLLALCSSIYGGAEAEDRERQVLELNDIRRPGSLEVGIDYLFPTKSTSAEVSF